MEKIAQAAEAVIYRDGDKIIKDRVKKSYRHPTIDEKLRLQRTRKEAKILSQLKALQIPAPELISMSEKNKTIEMTFIKGPKVREILTKDNAEAIGEDIGKKLGLMHKAGLIHGDLTTSNMIMGDQLVFIDFGLSYSSEKVEDMAVDLHLLRQALESKHHTIWEQCYQASLKGYKSNNPKADLVLERLEKVEKRGRYKKKG